MRGLTRTLVWGLALLLVLAPVVALLNGWFAADRWPLKRLRLEGEISQVEDEAVRTAIAGHSQIGFFAVDLDAVRRSVEALPWVRRAEARKVWPDTLVIRIHEHRAVAQWGEDRLLSDQGELFPRPQQADLTGLPRFDASEARILDVADVYRSAVQLLAPAGLTVRGVRLDARGSWTLTLGNGGEVLVGRGDPVPRLTRFGRAMATILQREDGDSHSPLLRADLRYSNGFAVRWAETAESPEGAVGSRQHDAASRATTRTTNYGFKA